MSLDPTRTVLFSLRFSWFLGFDSKTVQRSTFCRSRRRFSNAYFLAKFGFDTAANEPCKICPIERCLLPYLGCFRCKTWASLSILNKCGVCVCVWRGEDGCTREDAVKEFKHFQSPERGIDNAKSYRIILLLPTPGTNAFQDPRYYFYPVYFRCCLIFFHFGVHWNSTY